MDGGVCGGIADTMALLKARFAYKDSKSSAVVGRKVLLINASKVVPTASLSDEYSARSSVCRSG